MKIFSASQIRSADQATIANEPISSLDLMERASGKVSGWIADQEDWNDSTFFVFCGVGNNGGDGLVIARHLHQSGYTVEVFVIPYSTNYSEDFQQNLDSINALSIPVLFLDKNTPFPQPEKDDVIVDAIFGTGLNREPEGHVLQIIEKINASACTILSVDVPSGLFLEKPTQIAVQSDYLLTFQFTKLAFYLPDNSKFIKKVYVLDIGLSADFIENERTAFYYTNSETIKNLWRSVSKFAHKGTQGHALLIGGSFGKMGSIFLSSHAALRSGAGLLTAFVPKCGMDILQIGLPEAMVIADETEDLISNIRFPFEPDAVGIGPGLGQEEVTQQAFYQFLEHTKSPMVVDADALNILSKNPSWIELLQSKTILTPHPKELQRLIGSWESDFEKIEKTRTFARKHDLVILIKGAYTMVIDATELHVNSTGNPALSTAGSGDVLTGILTGLLAQGYEPLQAAIIGVYIHGLTADIAVPDTGYHSFIASDIIRYLGKAFLAVQQHIV